MPRNYLATLSRQDNAGSHPGTWRVAITLAGMTTHPSQDSVSALATGPDYPDVNRLNHLSS